MKIAIIQASSQKDKNPILEKCVRESIDLTCNEIINFGVFPEEKFEFSYIQTAFCISMLLESKAVDFVITGCSSGQGMMLACNSLPGVLCGYIANPSDAFLFGRINDGNAVSFPLGLNWGWAAEINLKNTMSALFSGPFGCGYPEKDAARKQRDTKLLKYFNRLTKRTLTDILPIIETDFSEPDSMNAGFLEAIFQRKQVCEFIIQHGENERLSAWLSTHQSF